MLTVALLALASVPGSQSQAVAPAVLPGEHVPALSTARLFDTHMHSAESDAVRVSVHDPLLIPWDVKSWISACPPRTQLPDTSSCPLSGQASDLVTLTTLRSPPARSSRRTQHRSPVAPREILEQQ